LDAGTRSGRGDISSMNEIRKEAREPISGSVLLDKLSTACISDLVTEHSPPGKWKLFVLNAGREVIRVYVVNGEKEGTVGRPWTLEYPE